MKSFFSRHKVEILVFVLALAVRLCFFFVNLDAAGGDLIATVRGQDGYYDTSRNIILGRGFSINPDPPYQEYSYGVPLYPYFLALLASLPGGYATAAMIQLMLGALIPLLGMRLARRLIPSSPRVPLAVGIILAFAPYQVLFSFIFYTEAVFTLIFGAFIMLFVRYLETPSTRLIVWSGVLLGLATLTKPVAQYVLLIAIAFALWGARKDLNVAVFKRLGYFVIVFIAVISPWIYRNHAVFDMPNLGSSVSFNLYMTLLPSVLSIDNHSSFKIEQDKLPIKAADIFYDTPKSVGDDAMREITKHPSALMKLSALSAFTFFTHDGMLTFLQASGIKPDVYLAKPAVVLILTAPVEFAKTVWAYLHTAMAFVLIGRLFWVGVAICAFYGLYALWKSGQFSLQVGFVVIVVGYFMTTTMINGLTVNARFRMPVEPIIIAIACAGLASLYEAVKRRYSSEIQ
ncbi:MAG: glycosyltransferase family 39 protein [Candidatus Paceibacterota bacterium]